ncbi:MAG TPA: hypothetical protein VE623_05275 [Acidimicrobiales bacterium]|nr:hypothetical protein [Acidimicrobiales bacterium]
MLTDYEFTRTLVADRQHDLQRQASRWRLARLGGRHRNGRRTRPSRRAASAGL